MYEWNLYSTSTCWKGDKGVVMHCKLTRYNVHNVLPHVDITVWGTDEPTVWVKAMDASSGYVDLSIITDPIINDEVRKWLYSSPVLSEWYEDAAKYRAAIAKVDLPYAPEDVQSEGKYLTYRFVIEGGREYDIAVVLEVDADSTRVTIGLQEAGNDDRYLHVSTGTIENTVTVHKVRLLVMAILSEFRDDLRDLGRVVGHVWATPS